MNKAFAMNEPKTTASMRSNPLLQILALAAAITLVILGSWSYSEFITSAQNDPFPDSPTNLSAQPGDTQVKLNWTDPGDTSITGYQLWQHVHSKNLTATERTQYDEFGYAVAIDGDTAVVGMPGEDSPLKSGAAFVFTRNSDTGTWSQVAKLKAKDPIAQDRLGLSVALEGDAIVVGSPRHANEKGAVYVYTRPNTLEG